MAVYSKLLLSNSGGITPQQQKAEQIENTATILIGLGGTGVHCIRTIKTEVYNRLQPDNGGYESKYDHIRFIGVDISRQSSGLVSRDWDHNADSRLSLNETEFFSIADPNLESLLKNRLALESCKNLSWFDNRYIAFDSLYEFNPYNTGVRQVGRLIMMNKSASFMERVKHEISEASQGLTEPQINIHVFTGLSGATGSGCFLDVCYMIRSIAEEISGINIFGYFFLPDINLARIPYEAKDVRSYLPKNGYAAMQELDYCMNLPENGGSFEQIYQGNKVVKWDMPPVDMCHLISVADESLNEISDGYKYAMDTVTEYVMDFLTKSAAKNRVAEQLANFKAMVRMADSRKAFGSNMAYCTIGASCASIPFREINTYLVSELFDKFGSIQNNVPSKAEVETLAVASLTNGETKDVTGIYDFLYRQITDDISDQYAAYPDNWKFVHDFGNREMITHYTNQTAEKLNRVEANARSMLTSDNDKSLLGKVMTQMSYIIRDFNRGPIYAYRMVAVSQSHNFLNIIDGLIMENNARRNLEDLQTELRESYYEGAKSDFDNCRRRTLMDTDTKRFADYEFYLKALEQHKLHMYILSKLDDLLRQFRAQLTEITASYYVKLVRVMETLLNTFAENKEALKNPAVMLKKAPCVIPIVTIEDIEETLDSEIAKIDAPGLFSDFMSEVLNNQDDWITDNENKIAAGVTRFFSETAFPGFADRTVASFLKDKYGNEIDDKQLSNIIYNEWIRGLDEKTRLLFCFDSEIWPEESTGKISIISIPAGSAEIKSAAEKMTGLNPVYDLSEYSAKDRVTALVTAVGFPISAYINCEQYEGSYFACNNPGIHYYEGQPNPTIGFTDWRKLPSVRPQSLINIDKVPEKLRRLLTEGREFFEKAHQFGVIDDEGVIYKLDEESVNIIKEGCLKCAEAIRKTESPEDIPELMDAVNNLKNLPELKLEKIDFRLPEDGCRETNEYVRRIQEDHFIYSPAIHEGVAATLKVIEDLSKKRAEIIAKAEEVATDTEENGKALGEYLEALFTGIISYEGRVIVYHQDSLGIKTDFTLCKKEDQFKFSAIPPYQGFESYKKLPKEVRDEINKLADARLNADAPELYSTVKALKEVFISERLNIWNQLASNYEEYLDILLFIRKLNDHFEKYCAESGI